MAASYPIRSRFLPKSIRTSLYSRSVATSNMKLIGACFIKLWSAQAFSSYFHKMATGGHFFLLSPKSTGFFHSRSSMAVSNMYLIRTLVSQLCGILCRSYVNHIIPEIYHFGDIIIFNAIASHTRIILYDPWPNCNQ